MATYYVWSGATGTNTGASWVNAFNSTAGAFSAAIAAATIDGDVILVHKTHTEELAIDTTYNFLANVSVFCVDKDNGNTAATMGTSAWIGNSTINRAVILTGTDKKISIYGITFRTAGASSDLFQIGSGSTGPTFLIDTCYLWQGIANTGANLSISGSDGIYAEYHNCTFRFGSTGSNFTFLGNVLIIGGSISSEGVIPNILFETTVGIGTPNVTCIGMDLSAITGTLVGDMANNVTFVFDRCKFGTGVTVFGVQTSNPSRNSAKVFLTDCSSGDLQGVFGYYDALGQVVSDTSVIYGGTIAGVSWRIDTSANVSKGSPFTTPWIDLYHSSTAEITPNLEILRNNSTTAFNNDQVWTEALVKTTSGTNIATIYTNECSVNATPAAQANGTGLSSWTGVGGTAWSGKLSTQNITPAENGYVSMRVCVGLASTTFYVDPQIRT